MELNTVIEFVGSGYQSTFRSKKDEIFSNPSQFSFKGLCIKQIQNRFDQTK